VALPPDIGAELAERAVDAGRHVLLEKPVALTVEAADRLIDAVTRAGVATLVFVTRRYQASLEEFLAGAAAGGYTGGRVAHRSAIFGADSPYRDSAWRVERGGLWDVGPHALGLILPVLGPVEAVTAMAGPHDTYHLILRHRDGAVSTLELTVNAPPAAAGWSASYSGPNGILAVPADSGLSKLVAYRAMVSRLRANVAAGTPGDPLDVRSGREMVAILAAAERSDREGVRVRL
jgi:predicted dehydrogenase